MNSGVPVRSDEGCRKTPPLHYVGLIRDYREQSKAVEEGAGRKRAGVITSQSGPANPSLRLRPWHTTGRSGEN